MKLKIKLGLVGILATLGLLAVPLVAHADSNSVNFEAPTYHVGSISGQDGWSNAVNPAYDQGVVATSVPGFGAQAFRISDAVTSGSFGDWVFAKPLTNAVGETTSTDGGFTPGTLQRHFQMQFDIASTVPSAEQPGLHISVSPDRGDGSRMSYLRFEDGVSGLNVFFDDVQGTTNPANFVETQIASGLDRTKSHNVKLTMDTIDGPSNDVVKVWIDGSLVHTGTSWENYYRYDSEASAEHSPRIVKTVIFQARGTATPADLQNGFLIDNLSLSSGPIPVGPPTTKDQCKDQGWKSFNNPTFKNKDKCVDYVNDHAHKISGDVKYTAYGLKREADMSINSANGGGTFKYTDANHDWYKVNVSDVSVSGHDGYFAGVVTSASNSGWVGQWLFAKVTDNHPDEIWGSFTTETAAEAGVTAMTAPGDGPFAVTMGNLKVN